MCNPQKDTTHTLGDSMFDGLQATIEMGINEILAERIVSRGEQMPGNRPENFCPFCAAWARRSFGQDWKAHVPTLRPLTYKMLARVMPIDGKPFGEIRFEKRYLCQKCATSPAPLIRLPDGKTFDKSRPRTLSEHLDLFKLMWVPTNEELCERRLVDLTTVNLDDPNFALTF